MRRAAIIVAILSIPVAVVLGLAFGLAACGDDGAEPTPATTVTVTATPSTSPSVDTSPGPPMTVALYFLRDEALGVAHRTVAATTMPATAAMNALLAGPNGRERAAGLGTTIPDGTTLNGVTIEDGVATVDLGPEFASGGGSASIQGRVAQVVYTLTQFSTVRRVVFEIDGEVVEALGGEGLVLDGGQRRADWEDLLPPIFVEVPAVGDTEASPVRVRGTAMVFEATFVAELLDARGELLLRKTVTATVGAPERGRFAVRMPFATGDRRGTLRVYEESMADGSVMNEVRIPLRFLAAD